MWIRIIQVLPIKDRNFFSNKILLFYMAQDHWNRWPLEVHKNKGILWKIYRTEMKSDIIPQLHRPSLNLSHDQHHGHEQMFWHLENIYSKPKQFYNLHQECPKLLQQHKLFQPQLYEEPKQQTLKLPEWEYTTSENNLANYFTSRLPASPK